MVLAAAGEALWWVHLSGALVLVGLTLVGPRVLSPYLAGFWAAMIVSFLIHRGCIITRLEQAVTGNNDTTIVDPFLMPFLPPGQRPTNRTRNLATLITGVVMLGVSTWKSVDQKNT